MRFLWFSITAPSNFTNHQSLVPLLRAMLGLERHQKFSKELSRRITSDIAQPSLMSPAKDVGKKACNRWILILFILHDHCTFLSSDLIRLLFFMVIVVTVVKILSLLASVSFRLRSELCLNSQSLAGLPHSTQSEGEISVI